MIIEFPEYTPDLPPINNPGMIEAKNVIPGGTSYLQVNGLLEGSPVLTGYARGAYFARDLDGDEENFFGDETKLYLQAAGLMTNVSQGGGAPYALTDEEGWDFTQFGDRVIAVTISEDMQSYQFGVSSAFADLTADATAPKARHIDTVGDFVVVGNTTDSADGDVPYRVRWCKINDATSWTVSVPNQADYQDLDPANGWINDIVGGADYGVIFQERAITTMHYVGSPAVFEFKTVERNNGTLFQHGAIRIGSLIYFIGIDGFYVFDGQQASPIGINKINTTFLNDIDTLYYHRVSVAIDFKKQLVCWSYPSVGAVTPGTPDTILFYNYSPNATKRWSYAELSHELLFNHYTSGYLMDPADGVYDPSTTPGVLDYYQINTQDPTVNPPDLDQLTPDSMDSQFWVGKNIALGAFSGDHKLSTFAGDPLTAVLETPEVQLNDGERTNLLLMRPVVDGTVGTITMRVRSEERR